jgi:hypothetical protein
MAEEIEHLPSKCEALSLSPSTKGRKKIQLGVLGGTLEPQWPPEDNE